MAKNTPTRRSARPTGRELVLAGIGAVSLARKQARAAATVAGGRALALRDAAAAEGERVRERIESRLADARKAIVPLVDQLADRATRLAANAPAGLQPLLDRIGLVQPKPVKKKAPAKRAPRRGTSAAKTPAKATRKTTRRAA